MIITSKIDMDSTAAQDVIAQLGSWQLKQELGGHFLYADIRRLEEGLNAAMMFLPLFPAEIKIACAAIRHADAVFPSELYTRISSKGYTLPLLSLKTCDRLDDDPLGYESDMSMLLSRFWNADIVLRDSMGFVAETERMPDTISRLANGRCSVRFYIEEFIPRAEVRYRGLDHDADQFGELGAFPTHQLYDVELHIRKD